MTMKHFFEPWERRPAHDDRLACVFFGDFEDIVGEVFVIHQLASNASDRVRRDSCARENRGCVLKHRPRRILSLPGPTLVGDIHLPVELFLHSGVLRTPELPQLGRWRRKHMKQANLQILFPGNDFSEVFDEFS